MKYPKQAKQRQKQKASYWRPGSGGGGSEERLLKQMRGFPFGMMKVFQNERVTSLQKTVNVLNATAFYILKWLKGVKYMMKEGNLTSGGENTMYT